MKYNLQKQKTKLKTESLCCTPETNTVLYINYTSIKKRKEFAIYKPVEKESPTYILHISMKTFCPLRYVKKFIIFNEKIACANVIISSVNQTCTIKHVPILHHYVL